MRPEERQVVERAIWRVTEQAANADAIVDEAMAAGLDGSDRLTLGVKELRAELLYVKADLEHELEREILDCAVCGRTVHYVGGLTSGMVIGRTPNRRRTPHPNSRRSTRRLGIALRRSREAPRFRAAPAPGQRYRTSLSNFADP
jgi:hypothetical protein